MKKSSIATAKWQQKVGLIAKTYKLQSQVTQDFAAACAVEGRSQAAVLTELMVNFTTKKHHNNPHCPHCGCHDVIKSGYYEGRQRYKCKECKRRYS